MLLHVISTPFDFISLSFNLEAKMWKKLTLEFQHLYEIMLFITFVDVSSSSYTSN